MRVILICAMSDNYVIGNGNKIPWRLPADLKFFKAVTMDSPMIMGRKTFESLPGILPGRLHIIITSNLKAIEKHQNDLNANPNVKMVNSLENALVLASLKYEKCYIVGGGQIYKECLEKKIATYAILTTLNILVDGDISFPYQIGRAHV